MDSTDHVHLAFLKRPELGVTLTKLHCWTLTRYSKCVFLDADTLVLCNIDELFERSEFSAAPDPGWPDCFNSGVFVFRPSLRTHRLLLQHAVDHGSYDGADQGLLNSFFSSWATADIQKHLPFVYNLSSSAAYTYSPAFRQFGSRAKVVHFLGPKKPWNYKYNPQTGSVLEEAPGTAPQHQLSFLNLWWNIYQHSILPLYEHIPDEPRKPSPGHRMTGCPEIETPAGVMPEPNPPPFPQLAEVAEPRTASVQLTETPADETGSGRTEESEERNQEPPVNVTRDPRPEDALQVDLAMSISEISIREKVRALSPEEQRRKWEEGHIDYMGTDAFARIQEKLDRFLQ
ncbi:PREDICTED: glycogenin-2 [Myotis brandtii]|uniref:glycogenin-2 n=1 Tax=Myotis brandtii TaxID=109478 RepID=UPI0007043064|nr:PREDICTED: glycogenin-2 [Myotis brandtii]